MAVRSLEQVGAPRTHGGGSRQKYILDERGRRLMLALYDGTSARIDELQRQLGAPRYLIRRWAQKMKLTRGSLGMHWRDEDIAYLKRYIKTKTLEEIADALRRTEESVRNKAYALGLLERDAYTLKDICEGLGCVFLTASKWLERGWLKGTRRGETGFWNFTDAQIRAFIIAHPEEIDLRRVEKLWFIDILAGGNHGIGALDNPRNR